MPLSMMWLCQKKCVKRSFLYPNPVIWKNSKKSRNQQKSTFQPKQNSNTCNLLTTGSYVYAYLRTFETEFRLTLFLFFDPFQLEFRIDMHMYITLKEYCGPGCLSCVSILVCYILNFSLKSSRRNHFSRDGIHSWLPFVLSLSKIWKNKQFLYR